MPVKSGVSAAKHIDFGAALIYDTLMKYKGGADMICPRCGSDNVNVVLETVSAKTKKKGVGCLWTVGRIFLIICTCGLWLLVGRRKGTDKTTFKNKTVALCQNCGRKWYVK